MPKYRITAESFIDNRLVKAGEEVETDATPGTHWEPLDKKAPEGKKLSDELLAEHVHKAQENIQRAEDALAVLAEVGVPTA